MDNEKDKEVEEQPPENMDKQIKELSLKEFNKVLDEIFKDNSLSDLEKVLVAKDLHKLTGRDFTYETIGKILGISKVGVLKVEKRALAKLKKECEKAGLSPADLKDIH